MSQPEAWPAQRSKLAFLLVSLAILVLDQWSKWWIEAKLPLYSSIEVLPNLLHFTHVRNTGVAFGLFAAQGGGSHSLALAALGGLALTIVGVYFWRTPRADRWLLLGLAMVLGGAVGNLIDRLSSGAVTDFVDFFVGTYHWHTFNLADSAITVGLGVMVLDSLRGKTAAVSEAETA